MSGYTLRAPLTAQTGPQEGPRAAQRDLARQPQAPRLPKVLRGRSVSRGGAGCECGGA